MQQSELILQKLLPKTIKRLDKIAFLIFRLKRKPKGPVFRLTGKNRNWTENRPDNRQHW